MLLANCNSNRTSEPGPFFFCFISEHKSHHYIGKSTGEADVILSNRLCLGARVHFPVEQARVKF